jgi:PadR family transcriptional regulator AphA
MKELTPAGRVILGMLRLRPHTGYEIKQLVDRSTRFFWAISYGQLYPELRRLEAAGLVTGREDAQNGRRRRAYELTPEGREALRGWLTAPEKPSYELRDEGLLKLFFADVIEPPERLELIRRMRARHEDTVARLEAIRPLAEARREEAGVTCPLEVLHGGIALHTFIADWCQTMERELEAEPAAERN